MDVIAPRIPRRLAAIFAADVAGYSRLMGADELGTLRALNDRRETMDALIAQHEGRIANTAGDSVLAEFASVVDALDCAIAVQCAHAETNASLPPDRRVIFRIGIHLGDVLVRGTDLLGDGVNLAARIQALAEPGGIMLSGKAREELLGKCEIPFRDRGEQALKNITRPVRVWEVAGPSGGFTSRRLLPRIGAGRATVALVALLSVGLGAAAYSRYKPGPPPQDSYRLAPLAASEGSMMARQLAASLTDRLASGLGAIPYVTLSVGDGRGAAPARYIVTGTVSSLGATTRVDARIVEAATERIVATARFDSLASAPNDIEDEVLGAVGDELSVQINRLKYPIPLDTEQKQRARSLAQQGRTMVDLRKDPAQILATFEEASRLNPDDIDIAGWRANALVALASTKSFDSAEQKVLLASAEAVAKPFAGSSRYHRLLGYAECQARNQTRRARAALTACEDVQRILPWSARTLKEIGYAQMQLGLLESALSTFTMAEHLNHQISARWIWEMKAALVCLLLGREKGAEAWISKSLAVKSDGDDVHAVAAVIALRLGDEPRARELMSVARDLRSKLTADGVRIGRFEDLMPTENATIQGRTDDILRDIAVLEGAVGTSR